MVLINDNNFLIYVIFLVIFSIEPTKRSKGQRFLFWWHLCYLEWSKTQNAGFVTHVIKINSLSGQGERYLWSLRGGRYRGSARLISHCFLILPRFCASEHTCNLTISKLSGDLMGSSGRLPGQRGTVSSSEVRPAPLQSRDRPTPWISTCCYLRISAANGADPHRKIFTLALSYLLCNIFANS